MSSTLRWELATDGQSHREAGAVDLNIVMIAFILLASLYGFISIHADNFFVRSIKDLFLVFFFLCSLRLTFHHCTDRSRDSLLFCIAAFPVLGLSIYTSYNGTLSYIYGVKITVLPMLMLFMGMYFGRVQVSFIRTFLVVYVLLIAGWLVQSFIGIDQLILKYNYVYGVNVKGFVDGTPRYSSWTVSPDAYAYTLAVVSIILEQAKRLKGLWWAGMLLRANTLVFLYLSTIRSALVLWLVAELVLCCLYLLGKRQGKQLFIAGLCFLPAVLAIVLPIVSSQGAMISTTSLLIRFSNWGDHLQPLLSFQGLFGQGLGIVGAASQRTAFLGDELSKSYAVDNQVLSIYQQLGAVGLLFFLLLFTVVFIRLVKNAAPERRDVRASIALLAGTVVSFLVTSSLEIYPFNVFLFYMLGMSMYRP